jgi:hypothetical protein
LSKDFTPITKVAQTKTYLASHKLSINQDKNTSTCGEHEQLIELSSFKHVLNIAIMTSYLVRSTKKVSHLIFTHPSIMTNTVNQLQTSIISEAALT